MIPQIVYPDHKIETYYEPKESIPPLKPRIRTKIVILSSPANMSYQESIIKMAQFNNLAIIVGETTGGVEGSINYSTLPSRLVVGWTGMKVVNLDGSQYHIKGTKPNIVITPTLEGLKLGKDEVLDKALEYLRTN
jgi:C-terminal processing protease CtpA/Prc